ncbi:MAG: hypothetical protein FWD31_05920 [Planctomycetaceae bacterium]|nr:hypothetical protein [Planctomycetaceae bacterium]
MTNERKISRRKMVGTVSLGLASTALAGTVAAQNAQPNNRGQRPRRTVPSFNNADFYGADGKFDAEKAKDAIFELCRYHRYPIFPGMREKLYVTDYNIGQFTTVGLACIFFVNNVAGESSYMMLEIFLLPNQMLAEHWHEKPDTPGCAQKNEGWQIRWGRSYVVGEGDANLPPEVVVPKAHWDGKVTVHHCTVADPGDFVPLTRLGSRHWQLAGQEGVILTEVANAHDGASVRHTDPTADAAFRNG